MKNAIKKQLSSLGYEVRKIPHTPQVEMEGTIVKWDANGTPIRFYLENRYDLIGKDLFNGRFFEQQELAELGDLVAPGGTMVDVGANIGNHAIYFARMLGAQKVIAFEPGGWAHPRLCFNIALNDLSDRITVHKCALSDHDGAAEMRFIAEDNHGTLAIMPPGEGEGDTQSVTMRRGDDILKDENITLLKVDAERHELQVLRGMTEVLTTQKPVILVEVAQVERAEMEAYLAGFGYRIHSARERYGDIVNLIATAR